MSVLAILLHFPHKLISSCDFPDSGDGLGVAKRDQIKIWEKIPEESESYRAISPTVN
jgi:hypothetical protein